MQVGIMISNGSTHSPEKWSSATCGQIIQIAADAAGEQAFEGRRLELKLLDIMEKYYATIQSEEKEGLSRYGTDRYSHPINISDHVSEAFDEVMAASKGSLFESHFMKEEVKEHVREVIRKDMQSIIEIERSWHKGEPNHRAV